jgi:hypothetical protein
VRRQTRAMQITDAAPSPAEELHHREVRYIVMMCVRAVCLILATVLVTARVPYLAIWVPVLVAGAVIIPWLAVVIANDRPPKRQYRLSDRLAHRPPDQRALTSSPPDPEPERKVIDAEP